MEPCLSCGIHTEFRESTTKNYFCQPLCQKKFYLKLTGLKGSFKRERPPALKEGPVWNLIVEYDLLKRENPDDPLLEKKKNDIVANLNKIIQFYANTTRFFELVVSLKDEIPRKQRLRGWDYKLADLKRKFKQEKKVPKIYIDSSPEDIDKAFYNYKSELEDYHKTCRIIIEKRIALQEEQKRQQEHLEYLGKLLERETDLERYSIEDAILDQKIYQSFIKQIESLRGDFELDSSSSSSSSDDDSDEEESSDLISTSSSEEEGEEEETEEIEVERDVEVVEGLTRAQLDVLLSVEDRIIEYERESKKPCIRYVQEYLANCDIVMHIPLYTILKKMVAKKDPFLRNLFEVGTGGGSTDREARAEWEHKIFQSEEYDEFPPHEKVKYATINWAHSRNGVSQVGSYRYGKSYLILRNDVKLRATYSRYDSSYPSVEGVHQLGTITRMCYISTQFTQEEKRLMEFYKPNEKGNPGMNCIKDYMEVQIHGELIFARDVAKIMISPHLDNAELRGLLAQYFAIIGRNIPFEFI